MTKRLSLKDYEVTQDGRVFSPHKEIKPGVASNDYLTFRAGSDGTQLLHRELAKRYIPNPENKRTVNHKDGNKLNNSLDNLEWATDSENNRHSFEALGRKGSRGRMRISDKDAQFIMDMKGIMKQRELAEMFGIPRPTVAQIHAGNRKILEQEEKDYAKV